ncbi:MAG: acyltransferase [Pseudonocardiales bacterium]|nr:acyltransferase [Pseudonocardiales bacterium]
MAISGVRPARSADAAEIARLQLSTWRTAYTAVLPVSVLEGLDEASAAQSWIEAIRNPPTAGHHVLLGVERDEAVGFVAFAVFGATVDIGPLLVEPRWGRRGNGSRLLAAATDIAKAGGATKGVAWIPEQDTVSDAFFAGSGWAPDGRVRILDTGDGELREICLHTTFSD